ncbi:LLM class F420-dependent oxidoreductase [Yinghuangia sp. YIM S09857]|uniref:LLM class F420-dependent oxidoreductase n=1 Tax=Yinghuangia sp. YIM S09857 TaxID=3436929 RepID=UPI003F52FADB
MRLSTTLKFTGDAAALLDRAVEFEEAGVDAVWVTESYGFDSVAVLGAIAARTKRVQVGPGVLNVFSRTPALLAQTAAGLDAASAGRAVLGLGTSGPQVVEGWHGLPYDRPLARTRDVVEICRAAWRREVVVHSGATTRVPLGPQQGTGLAKPLKMLTRPVRDRIPVYLAALGPKNVELTAEIADGWLTFLFAPERMPEVWGKAMDAGLARRPAESARLDIVAGGVLAIGEDRAALRDLARPMTALYVGGMGARGQNFYHALVSRYGFADAADRIQDLYLTGRRAEAEAAVPDELIDLIHLVGPADHVAGRIEAYRKAGVTTLNATPEGADPVGDVRTLRALLDAAAE